MKKILLSNLLICFCLQLIVAQVPQNDLIENATLITGSEYQEANIRLDLATATAGIATGCNIEAFPRIYYKFTAQSNSTLSVYLYDQSFNPIGTNNSFVIAYNAPDLNVTNENQFTSVASACSFGTSLSINTVQGQSYYILVHRSEANVSSRITMTIPQTVPQSERDALVDLYNATNGNNWTNNTNWNSSPFESNWHGVTVANGHVVGLDLRDNNLEGNIPSSITNLTFLQNLNISRNKVDGTLPNLSTISVQNVDIQFNDFSFADLETHFAANNTIAQFLYERQNNIDDELLIDNATIGSNYNLTTSIVNGTSINYQWYKLRSNIGGDDEIISGANSNVYSITNAQEQDFDNYTCYITSPAIPDMVLKRNPIKLRAPVSQQERDALIAFYNALDGPNWTDNTNWLSSAPVGDWAFVETRGDKVVGINIFGNAGLSGQLPQEIGDLIHLENLSIGIEPGLVGPLPSTIGNLSALQRLRIQATGNSGSLPATIGNLTNLKEIRFIGNNFSGDLPIGLSNMTNLEDVYLIGSTFPYNGNFNQFTGALPDLTNNPNLFRIQVSGNEFSGLLPDYSALPNMTTLIIDNNQFTFGDLETNQVNNGTIASYIYSPQQKISEDQTILVNIGDNQTLEAVVSGTNNQYQWYFNNQPIAGATNATLVLSNLQNNDFGAYKCVITNSIVTDLTLETGVTTIGLDPTQHPDYNALVAFYNATNGDNWTNNTNWLDTSQPVSSWYGVLRLNGGIRVAGLSLFNNNLEGSIPAEIGDLTELTFLHVGGNPLLEGSLPNEITNLSNLETLAVYDCSLNGELPANIGNLTNLTYLGLFNNSFFGELPASFANLTQIETIEINNNNFSGSIPFTQTGLANLRVFVISDNRFEGTLPDFTAFPNLQTLWIQNNKFQFGDFENEHNTYVSNSNLNYAFSPQKLLDAPESIALAIGQSGTVPSGISGSQNTYFWIKGSQGQGGSVVSNDQDLNLNINSAADYGSYYLEITSALVPGLTLTTNNFNVEDLPSNHPDYNALVALYNSTNGDNWLTSNDGNTANDWLNNSIPMEDWFGVGLDANNRVRSIIMNNNNLTGSIPPEIGNLTELTLLGLQNSGLTGEIPETLWNLNNLTILALNNTSGNPASTLNFTTTSNPTIGQLTNLTWLSLSDMIIPQQALNEIETLQNLDRLQLSNCDLGPNLPASWASISNLYLADNEFEGAIPVEFQTNAINGLNLVNNFYDFADLEPLTLNNNITSFYYSPQRTRDVEEYVESQAGQDIVLTVDESDLNRTDGRGATSNTFQWFKDDVAIPGATNSSYTIFNAQASDVGAYYCEVTNPLLPDLTIQRADIMVDIDGALTTDKVRIDSKVILNGAYDGSLGGTVVMDDQLRANNLIPDKSPYQDRLRCDSDVFLTTGENAIIDWVWVEIRGTDGTTVIDQQSALLQADGDIVNPNGYSTLIFDIPNGDYRVMIAHRNHIGIISENSYNLTQGNTVTIDLKNDSNLITGGTNGIADMGDGNLALFAGDYNGDGQVQNTDRSGVEVLRGNSGYSDADLDMNGQVQNSDIQNLLNPNLGKGQQFTSRTLNLKLYAKRANQD